LTEPEETGASYLENAVLKARYYSQATGLPALADDSGLEVDALDGQPGLYSARFAGHDTPHSFKIQKVLELLGDRPDAERTARFRCVAALVEPGGQPLAAEGVVEGTIARAPAGEGGFGYDPIFWMADHGKTMAELPETTKNRLSHRAKALLGLMQELGWGPAVD
jgi:XTP/dITP diphosphohydrolase